MVREAEPASSGEPKSILRPSDLRSAHATHSVEVVFREEEPVAENDWANVFGRCTCDRREPSGWIDGPIAVVNEAIECELLLIGGRHHHPAASPAIEGDGARLGREHHP